MVNDGKEGIVAQLKEFADILPNPFYWLDRNQHYLGVNRLGLRVTGTQSFEKDFLGKTPYALYPEAMAKEIVDHHKEVIRTGQVICTEESIRDVSTQEIKYFNATIAPLFNKQRNIIGTCGISIDITQEKRLTEQLMVQKEKAEAANRSKTEFIANMSHDLRTPITGMLGMIQDLLNTANQAKSSLSVPKSSQRAIVLSIIDTALRDGHYLMSATDELLQLCNEILEVVRLESGKPEDNVESFDLRELIEHNIELLQPVACHKKLQLSYKIDRGVPRYLSGFRIYLDRVLLNLISNALKFTENGTVKIAVAALEKSKVGENIPIQISVKDTGIGIPNDKFETIFEHFSRLTPAYEGLYKGAGLGLYTVKRYIEAMNGNIHVESELSKGTCFTVTLPFTVSDHSNRIKQTVYFPKTAKPVADKILLELQESVPAEGAAAIILVVEDNTLAAIAVKLALESFDCSADIAENGTKAIQMAQDNHYDLILMDIGLPDMGGIEVARKIRALSDPIKSQVPIVALTGHAGNSHMRQESLDAGMQEVLSKPAQHLALQAILQDYVFKTGVQKQSTHETTLLPSEKTESLDIIDWDACIHMCNGDPDFTYKMLSMLATDLKNTKAILAEAYANNDLKTLCVELHRVRGGVCYLKVPQLEYALRTFHETIKVASPDPERLKQTYADLQQAIDAFQAVWEKGEF